MAPVRRGVDRPFRRRRSVAGGDDLRPPVAASAPVGHLPARKRADMSKTIRIPVYTFGKYRAQDGTYEEFTDEKMRTLVKNTNFVIQSKAFIPTFGYVGY